MHITPHRRSQPDPMQPQTQLYCHRRTATHRINVDTSRPRQRLDRRTQRSTIQLRRRLLNHPHIGLHQLSEHHIQRIIRRDVGTQILRPRPRPGRTRLRRQRQPQLRIPRQPQGPTEPGHTRRRRTRPLRQRRDRRLSRTRRIRDNRLGQTPLHRSQRRKQPEDSTLDAPRTPGSTLSLVKNSLCIYHGRNYCPPPMEESIIPGMTSGDQVPGTAPGPAGEAGRPDGSTAGHQHGGRPRVGRG